MAKLRAKGSYPNGLIVIVDRVEKKIYWERMLIKTGQHFKRPKLLKKITITIYTFALESMRRFKCIIPGSKNTQVLLKNPTRLGLNWF